MDTNNISNTFQNYYDYIKFNPILLTVLIIILVLYFIMFSSLGSSENDNSFEANSDSNSDSGLFNILGIVIAIILIIVLIIYGSQYFLNVDIIGNIKNYFTQKHEVNVVLNEAFDKPTIAVDTHGFRVSNRTGLTKGKNPNQVEEQLLKITPKEYLKKAHHLILLHGRHKCKSRNPICTECVINKICIYKDKNV